jgi:sugar lactone lactonase YvrE
MRPSHLVVAAVLAAPMACDDSSTPGPKACPDTPGTICTYIGNGKAGFDGDMNPLHESRLYWPVDISFTSTGAYVLDWNNHRVRKVTDDGLVTVMGTDFVGDGDPIQGDLEKPGVAATTIDLNHPTQLVEMPDGNLMLVSWHNHKLRVWDPTTGLMYVLCGRGAGYRGDGEAVTGEANVLLNQPSAVVYDKDDNLYVLDQRNERIRRIKADGTLIETVVGTGEKGFGGDGGDPLLAIVNFPKTSNPPPAGGMAFDADGRLYFSDILNHRIRRVDFVQNRIDTVYGDGTTVALNNPRDIEIGPDGRLYIADELNHRVLALDVDSLEAEVVAGKGSRGYSGDYGPAAEAELSQPTGVAFDAAGDLYIADSQNNRIRVVRMGDK